MAQIKDLSGQTFGRLTAIERAEGRNPKRVYWLCECSCDEKNQVIVQSSCLTGGNSQSCGCLRNEHTRERNCKNIVGKKFGRLTVIAKSDKRDKCGRIFWECECDCPDKNKCFVIGSCLQDGNTSSCGCYDLELKRSRYGQNATNWNHDKTDEERIKERSYGADRKWARDIKERDNYLCQCCMDPKKNNLVSHHLYSYCKYRNLRTDLNNGICLCTDCHNKFHKEYGKSHNTRQQYEEFAGEPICLF